ncbi:hypothetical protein GALMADRAFT_743292 [Galerina marginata CBS 339.88]|uniref:F-box domain-containing protein n=1 Tax=Galerina marginata (strain CBS 339.88) TaxID=685588 RepID=A0A067SPX5_GALM3|nr:hypothetical protein GALMADRAFT_743292 [Galerina marginata CBS 339.88]
MAESTDVIANGPLNLTDAPMLHDLTLEDGANLSNSNAYILFSLQQIDRLGLLNFTALETVQQLTRLPNLVEARFTDVRLITQEPTTAPAHTKLARLYLCFSDDETLGYFTSALTLPALESLEVKVNYKSSSDFAMNTIHPFLHRSQCKLAQLRLRYRIDYHDSPDLVGLLARLSSLRELDICVPTGLHTPSGLDNRLFDALRHLQHPSFLPLLQIFSYEGPFLTGTNLAEIMEPLILRATNEECHGIHDRRRLESVWIQTDYLEGNLSGAFISPGVLIEVKRLVASGCFQLLDMKRVSWFSS